MAKATIKMPEDFLIKLSRLDKKTDEIIPVVLKAGGDVVKEKVKRNLQCVIGKSTREDSRSTGELVNSLGVSSAKKDKEGNFNVKVGFSDSRKNGIKNSMIAGVLEYGKQGQPPKPFLKPAKVASRKPCVDAMIKALDEEVGKI